MFQLRQQKSLSKRLLKIFKKLNDLMIFAQVDVMKKLHNEMYIDNVIDSFNEKFNFEIFFVMIQIFKAIRRRELKIQNKIKRKNKRLSIRKFMHIEITIDKFITMTF